MEFQAVILCGPGKRLHPITTGTCKPLLPVGNKPLIQYAIEWCGKAGFASTTVAVAEPDYDEVLSACLALGLMIQVVKTPDHVSSGEVLKLLETNHVLNDQCDLAIIPCDLITNFEPEALISTVRSQETSMAITGFYYRNQLESLDVATLDPDVLLHSVLSAGSSTQCLLDSYERQCIKEAKLLKPRMAMLWQFPQVVATMDLLRSGIFFIRRSVLAYDNIDFHKPLPKVIRDVARRTWCHRTPHEVVVLHILPNSGSMLRANTLPAYMEANRLKLREQAKQAHAVKPREAGQAVIGNDSIVGTNTTVGERSSVKRTAIGKNCEVGRKCRLNGCVILDNVKIGNDVTLENCLVGHSAVIEQKSRLVGCSVEGSYSVVCETEAKNEILKGLSMEGIDNDEFGDMYESISEDSETSEESDDGEEGDGLVIDGEDFFDRV